MAYEDFEETQANSRPVELYTFTTGAVITRVTSAEDDYTEAADVFTAIPIKRNALGATGGPDGRKASVVLTVPGDSNLVSSYISSVPGTGATVRIERIQREDGAQQTVTIFTGRITSVAWENSARTAKIKVEPTITVQSKPVPTVTFQGLCNNVLYDDFCQVDDTDPAYRLSAASVTAVTGSTITVTGADANGDGYYTGGWAESAGAADRRLILDQTGTLLTLLLPFAESPLGTSITVFAGCDHAIATCKGKFDNVLNFGGSAFVPSKNIFATGIRI